MIFPKQLQYIINFLKRIQKFVRVLEQLYFYPVSGSCSARSHYLKKFQATCVQVSRNKLVVSTLNCWKYRHRSTRRSKGHIRVSMSSQRSPGSMCCPSHLNRSKNVRASGSLERSVAGWPDPAAEKPSGNKNQLTWSILPLPFIALPFLLNSLLLSRMSCKCIHWKGNCEEIKEIIHNDQPMTNAPTKELSYLEHLLWTGR